MRITFIGGGNMAQAIIGGLVKKSFDRAGITVVEVLADTRERVRAQLGVRCVAAAREAAPLGDLVVMAVKPQDMRTAAIALHGHLQGQVVLSIAAGISLSGHLLRWLTPHTKIIRAMPNTPALIGCGVTAMYEVPYSLSEEEKALAKQVMSAIGKVVWVKDEDQMNAVTALSGSGPAYVFYFIEALEEAGKQFGLPADVVHTLAVETFLGAAELAANNPDPVSVLRQRVTSKGGTTEAALAIMARDQVKEAIIRAIHAANERARELGEELGKDG